MSNSQQFWMSEDHLQEGKKEDNLSQNIKDLLILYSVLSLEDKVLAKREIRNAEIFQFLPKISYIFVDELKKNKNEQLPTTTRRIPGKIKVL